MRTAARPRSSQGAPRRVSCASSHRPLIRSGEPHRGGVVTATSLYWAVSADAIRRTQPAWPGDARPFCGGDPCSIRRPRSTTSVMIGGSSPIRILVVDDHPSRARRDRRSHWGSAQYGRGRRSRQRPRCDSAIPHAPSGRHAHGHPDAGDERPRRAHRLSHGVPGCEE